MESSDLNLEAHRVSDSPPQIPPAQPIRKTRLWSLGESASSTSQSANNQGTISLQRTSLTRENLLGLAYQTGSSPLAPLPRSVVTFIHNTQLDTEMPTTFGESHYPSQRFRPEEYEQEGPYYTPPPQVFSPSISEGQNSVEKGRSPAQHFDDPEIITSSDKAPQEMKLNACAPAYQGPATGFHQNSSITPLGMISNVSQLTDPVHGGLHTIMSPVSGQQPNQESDGAEDKRKPSTSDETSRSASYHTAYYESPLSSEPEICPSSGVRLDGYIMDTPNTNRSQTKTFQQLSQERGIKAWNNDVFDERWLERSKAPITGFDTKSSDVKGDKLPAEEGVLNTSRRPRLPSFLKELDDKQEKTNPAFNSYKPDRPIYAQNLHAQNPQPRRESFVPHYMPEIDPKGYRYAGNEGTQPISDANPSNPCSNQQKNQEFPDGKSLGQKTCQDQIPKSASHEPFGEKLGSSDSRQPFIEQLRNIDGRAQNPLLNASRGVLQQNTVKHLSANHVTSKTSNSKNQHVDHSAADEGQHSQSPHEDYSSSQTTLAASNTGPAEVANIDGMLQQQLASEDRQAHVDTNFPQNSRGHEVTPQHQQFPLSAIPTGMLYPARNPEPWSSMPALQQGYGYQQTGTSFHHSIYAAPQPMQYRPQPAQFGYSHEPIVYPPVNDGPPPPSNGLGGHWQYPLHIGPPPPVSYHNAAMRPPAANRVAAYVYRNDPAFQYSGLPQVRGTPAFSRPPSHSAALSSGQAQYEWNNRFGIIQTVRPLIPVLPYRPGSDDMRPHASGGTHSVPYQDLTRHTVPSFDEVRAPENNPFGETAKEAKPPSWGVLKIGNIPYDLTKPSVTAFLGTHAKLISHSFGPSIHIIMDRNSGKTMDCFVEFLSTPDARACCNSVNLRQHGLNRISERMVDVTMSSQDELLAVLFPKAKNVKWDNGSPIIVEAEEEWSSGFKNFVSAEELGLMVRHAEQPHRSNFTLRSPQRPYEAMISLLAKYPWSSVENYTVSHRNQIFNAVRQMLHILSINIRKEYTRSSADMTFPSYGSSPTKYGGHGRGPSGNIGYNGLDANGTPMLNEQLLEDLLSAGLNAAGFSEKQRWELYEMCDYARHHFIVSPLLQFWPFEVLNRKTRVEEDVVELYAIWLVNNPEIVQTGNPFGSIDHLLRGIDVEGTTMHDMGVMENKILDALLMGGLENARKGMQLERAMGYLTL